MLCFSECPDRMVCRASDWVALVCNSNCTTAPTKTNKLLLWIRLLVALLVVLLHGSCTCTTSQNFFHAARDDHLMSKAGCTHGLVGTSMLSVTHHMVVCCYPCKIWRADNCAWLVHSLQRCHLQWMPLGRQAPLQVGIQLPCIAEVTWQQFAASRFYLQLQPSMTSNALQSCRVPICWQHNVA